MMAIIYEASYLPLLIKSQERNIDDETSLHIHRCFTLLSIEKQVDREKA